MFSFVSILYGKEKKSIEWLELVFTNVGDSREPCVVKRMDWLLW